MTPITSDSRNHVVKRVSSDQCLPISLVVLTYNEECNLSDCLASVAGWTGELFVVDSGSSDRTSEIARRYEANILFHPFETHARQWHWALQNLPCRYEWILCLDADQRITPALRDEMFALFGGEADSEEKVADVDGFYIKRRQIFRGQWIKHGGYYPKYLLKLFRIRKVHIDLNDHMDHHFYVSGRVAKFRNDLIEENQKEDDISFWIDKHNRYAALLARQEFHFSSNNPGEFIKSSLLGNPDQRTLWLKHVWRRLPLYVRPFLYFFYRYFLRLGFLDGKQGFVFHFLQGFWFRLLVDIKLDELRREQRTGPRSEVGGQISEISDQRSGEG